MAKKEREGMSKRQEFRERRRRAEQRNRMIVIGGIVLVVGIVAFFIIYPMFRPLPTVVHVTPQPHVAEVSHNTEGDPKAPITLTVFSDFQCPFCKEWWTNTEAQVEEAYIKTNKVYFVYRSSGNWVSRNDPGNTESQDAAMAAYCAADQNKFWEMHDALFANNQDLEDQGSFATRRLQAIAQSIGLDMTTYNSCMSSNKYLSEVEKDGTDFQQTANAADPNNYGTPYFVITYTVDGQAKTETINGAQGFSAFQQKLDAALAAVAAK